MESCCSGVRSPVRARSVITRASEDCGPPTLFQCKEERCVCLKETGPVFFLLCRGVEFWRFSHWITCAWELMVYSLSALFHTSLAHQSYRSIYSPNNQTVFPAHTEVLQPSARINLRERVLLWCYSDLLQCFLIQVRDISCGSWHMMALTAGQYSATHPYTVNSHGGRLENISSRLTNEPIPLSFAPLLPLLPLNGVLLLLRAPPRWLSHSSTHNSLQREASLMHSRTQQLDVC